MTKYEVLNQLSSNEIDYQKAYEMLYPKIKKRKARKARFVKLKINIPDSKGASAFVNTLFLFPIPISFIMFFLRKRLNEHIDENIPMSIKDFVEMGAVKGAFIEVIAKDNTHILIKTI
ncbi:hypothetical protein [Mariniplasma anaerobium]|uniref:Uncharacterized protein n=1 Tax=Mariniplasma anaerobium TaxID=2735436 RepID=A0A7U9TIP8_9MOLU|nr:hypothetical protein [Mariniplasma anaerobium]BCR35515.1 hypothetical protein MPAN_004080 [Mariniplasma anaerobium]